MKIKVTSEIEELLQILEDFMNENEWGEPGEAKKDIKKIISYFYGLGKQENIN